MEVKYAQDGAFETACNKAMRQIEEKRYAAVLLQEDIQTIHKYAIACYKKAAKWHMINCSFEIFERMVCVHALS